MKVTEIFYSLQGEGVWLGKPAVFLRLGGCLAPYCPWCDTRYAWDEARDMDQEAVLASMARYDCRTVVITGGEPLLQTEAVVELIDALRADDHRAIVDIETNGSLVPSEDLIDRVDFFVVSPKLAHAGNDETVALKPDALRRYAELPSASYKFVCTTADDVDAVAKIAETYAFAPQRIYIMPEGVTSEAIRARGPQLIDAVIKHGFNYSDRLHIHLFGQKRGV